MFTKCKDVRRLDPEKSLNKLFENVLIFKFFFRGVKGDHILTFFPAELLRGKAINENSSKGVGGNATSKFF